jgi:hypothetical protein
VCDSLFLKSLAAAEEFVVAFSARSAFVISRNASAMRDRDRLARGRQRTLHFVFRNLVSD